MKLCVVKRTWKQHTNAANLFRGDMRETHQQKNAKCKVRARTECSQQGNSNVMHFKAK